MENKQTLEELYFKRNPHRKVIVKKRIDDFIAGAECQAERMYSEEEVKRICKTLMLLANDSNDVGRLEKFINNNFEQFKKD
jgi:hypothetical protein